MESIPFSSASSGSFFRASPVPRRLLVCNVQTEAKPPAPAPASTDQKPAISPMQPEPPSRTLKSTKRKPATVQSFSSQTPKNVPPSRALAALFCNTVDDVINKFIEKPLKPSVDPRFVLSGNFAPVKETPATGCLKVRGTLPACLDGIYIRNGPNPSHLPRSAYHSFDGDGMLHAVRIRDGAATFCSRFVRTNKYVGESGAGGQLMPNVFAGFNGVAGIARGALLTARVALGLFNPHNGFGLANTSLLFFDHKLMALGESDVPYIIRVTDSGDLETVGRYDFEGRLFMGMTAHPKVDPETGELFAFRYGPVPPFLNYFRVAPSGEKEPDVGIPSLRQLSFIHDFAVTRKYAVFPDTQIVAKPFGGDGSLIGYDGAKVARLGIIPRYATDESAMKWIEVPGFNFFHSINAWDEGEEIVLVAANAAPVEHVLERQHLVRPMVEEVRINLAAGKVRRKRLSSKPLEFGVMNPKFVTKKNRFAYMSLGAPFPKIKGIVKLDFERGEVAARDYGDGCLGSEPFFVPRTSELNAAEDDGYVVSYIHDERSGVSSFVVMDAQSPTLEIVASVELPVRVPYGFHGLFVSQKDLEKADF